ncbi:hypothetical protein [Actinoplanes rectilineatus]|uniref:hypothetical protein n=1 Tax=Actinoplanes rectilineatus TaxID=113571 RepID=UPI0005F2E962|nr:hypothetical protein [Actinoplanes rectilineatus]
MTLFSAAYYAELARTMNCPRCDRPAGRDEVDNGVGILVGPYGCPCGWSENPDYDTSGGPRHDDAGYRLDQWGGATPPQTIESEIR